MKRARRRVEREGVGGVGEGAKDETGDGMGDGGDKSEEANRGQGWR